MPIKKNKDSSLGGNDIDSLYNRDIENLDGKTGSELSATRKQYLPKGFKLKSIAFSEKKYDVIELIKNKIDGWEAKYHILDELLNRGIVSFFEEKNISLKKLKKMPDKRKEPSYHVKEDF